MPAVHVRNVPDETILLLKERAARHGRSLEAELRAVLEDAAAAGSRSPGSILERIVAVSSGRAESMGRDEIYADDDPDGR